jgi:hypothetical protein
MQPISGPRSGVGLHARVRPQAETFLSIRNNLVQTFDYLIEFFWRDRSYAIAQTFN